MISVIIPTLNEEKRIGAIIEYLKSKDDVSEILVIDDGSTDSTFTVAQQAGANVFFSSMLGKGASMHDGLMRAKNENVLFLDGDIYNFSSDLVELMIAPLLQGDADLVKGRFSRASGRVTTLTAKPMLQVFFPELVEFQQPLGGIIAGNRDFLKRIKFENDYGVDVGLMIDIHQLGGRIKEVPIGYLDHDHQSLEALGKMANQVVRTILDRASRYQRLHPYSIFDSKETERVEEFQFASIFKNIDPEKPMILFDMDGTLIEGSFIEALTQYAGLRDELKDLLGNHRIDPIYRTEMIAQVLNGIPKFVFEKIAGAVPLKPKAAETIVELKRQGFQVGIITDSYFIASEVIRKRVFADFSVAHLLEFRRGKATGEIQVSPLMLHSNGCQLHGLCKSNFILHLFENFPPMQKAQISAIGDGENDICLFGSSGKSFAVFPKSPSVEKASQIKLQSLEEILQHL